MWWASVVNAILGAFFASSAIRLSLVETLSGPDVPGIFPSNGSIPRCPLSSAGSSWGEFPCLMGHTRHCDALPPFPPHFVSFAWRYHPSVPGSLPEARDASLRAWVLVSGPPTANRRWRRQGLPRFLGEPPCTHAPFSDPGGASASCPIGRLGVAFRFCDSVGPHNQFAFEAR